MAVDHLDLVVTALVHLPAERDLAAELRRPAARLERLERESG